MTKRVKLLCLGSLLLGFFLISNLLPFPGFIDEVFITALAFPFFSRRLRIRITIAVQGLNLFTLIQRYSLAFLKYGDLAIELVKNQLEFGSYLGGHEPLVIPVVSQIGEVGLQGFSYFNWVCIMSRVLYPGQVFLLEMILRCLLVLAGSLYIIAIPVLLIIGLTAPYSLYLIIKWMGFYRLVERNTGGTIKFND